MKSSDISRGTLLSSQIISMKKVILYALLLSVLLFTVSCDALVFGEGESTDTDGYVNDPTAAAPDYSKFEFIRNDIANETEKYFSCKEEYYSAMNDAINDDGVLEMLIRVYYDPSASDAELITADLDEIKHSSKISKSDGLGMYTELRLTNPVDAEKIEALSKFNGVRKIKITVERCYLADE